MWSINGILKYDNSKGNTAGGFQKNDHHSLEVTLVRGKPRSTYSGLTVGDETTGVQ